MSRTILQDCIKAVSMLLWFDLDHITLIMFAVAVRTDCYPEERCSIDTLRFC